MNMTADSHQLLQFAIENDDTDLIHLILINERILRNGDLNYIPSCKYTSTKNGRPRSLHFVTTGEAN